MNKALLDPFTLNLEYPEALTAKYNWGNVALFEFNSTGDYALAGLLSGDILIIDTDSWEPIGELVGHSDCIVSIEWSKDSTRVVSAARDMHVFVWDVHKRVRTHRSLIGAVAYLSIGPNGFVINPAEGAPIYNLFEGDQKFELPIKKAHTSLCFDDGRILIGDSTGNLSVFSHNQQTNEIDLIYSQKICGSSITELKLRQENKLFMISQDRAIRVIEMEEEGEQLNFEVKSKILDQVNRFHWYNLVTTPTCEYTLAVPLGQARSIYMWETSTGQFENVYRAPEEILSMAFHPSKVILIATGMDTATAYKWDRKFRQEWGALAPDFVELVQNEYYHEREDEFDIINETPDTYKSWPQDKQIDIYESEVPVPKPILN